MFYSRVMKDYGVVEIFRFYSFILPSFTTLLTFLLLSPILLKKQPIAKTLHCNGDLRFFGDDFPETIVEMKHLRRTPKPSKYWSYEDLLFRNMMARLRNLTKPMFWKLLWERWICRGCSGRHVVKDTKKKTLDYVMVVVWFSICMILVILHVVPLFSVWANYVRKQIKLLFVCTEKKIYWLLRMVAVPLQLLGIFFFYLMMWNLLVIMTQFVVFIFIDILRNVATTLSKIILILAIFLYLRKVIQDFEDEYRELKSVTFDLCLERSKELEDEESRVVVKLLSLMNPFMSKLKMVRLLFPKESFTKYAKCTGLIERKLQSRLLSYLLVLPW